MRRLAVVRCRERRAGSVLSLSGATGAPDGRQTNEVPDRRELRARSRRDTDGGVDAGRGRGPPRLLPRADPGAGREWRADRQYHPHRARPGEDRPLRRPGSSGGDGRTVPGVQGVAGRLPDRGGRVGRAGDRDRGAGLGSAGSERRTDPAADPPAPGHGRRGSVRPVRDGGVPPAGNRSLIPVGTDREDLLRELAPQVLAVLVRRYGDFDSAEDAVQEALIAAHRHWTDGVPEHPLGWLVQTASRRMLDGYRSESSRRDREVRFARVEPPAYDVVDRDDSLVLLFMACHPVLTETSAIALTLRAVGGLTTAEIARAFLVPEATMAQRISRAKRSLRDAGATFTLPSEVERPDRLPAVLRVLYLIYNEGHTASGGADLQRVELSAEAIRLTRMLHRMLPDDGEVSALLALMLLLHARRAARTDAAGQIVPLAEQDRTRWDRAQIDEGRELLDGTMGSGVGEYRVQAA